MTQAIASPSISPCKMTYEEFLLQDHGSEAVEWENGEVLFMTVSAEHSDLNGFLYEVIKYYARRRQSGRVFAEPFQMKTGANLPGRAPDVCFLATENLSRLKKNHIAGPADLAVEIVSPESVERDYITKYAEYEQGGVREYWIVDPLKQDVHFYVRDANGTFQERTPNEEGVYHSVAMDGLWIEIAWLWRDPQPEIFEVMEAWGMR